MELIKNDNVLKFVERDVITVDSNILDLGGKKPKQFVKEIRNALENRYNNPYDPILFNLATYQAAYMILVLSDTLQIEYQKLSDSKHRVVITKDGKRKYCYYRKSPIAKPLDDIKRDIIQAVNDGYISMEDLQALNNKALGVENEK